MAPDPPSRPAAGWTLKDFGRQMLRPDAATGLAKRHGALNFVPKLPHVAGPPVHREQLERFGGQKDVRLAEPLRGFAQEEAGEMRDFFAPIAQRRNHDPDDGEPVVKIFAELALGHALLQVGIGRGEHADVNALRPRFAERHDLALLEKAQQLRLHVQRQVADFVEEQRARPRPSAPARADRSRRP